jgi:hypothetical protein
MVSDLQASTVDDSQLIVTALACARADKDELRKQNPVFLTAMGS